MLPPLVTEITMEQSFEIAKIRNDISKVTKEQLEELFISLLMQKMVIDNNFKQLVLHM